jgi:hypothetical protein
MHRVILSLAGGMASVAMLVNAFSVYVMHDVDSDQIGHWNEAYIELSAEVGIFIVVVGGLTWLLILLGRRLFHLQGAYPRPRLAFVLGALAIIIQYPMDFAVRTYLSVISRSYLHWYLLLCILTCTGILLRDNWKQLQLQESAI